MNRFWIKQLAIGRLHLSIVRNDTWKIVRPRRTSISVDRAPDLGVFTTIRVGTLFLNVDLLVF